MSLLAFASPCRPSSSVVNAANAATLGQSDCDMVWSEPRTLTTPDGRPWYVEAASVIPVDGGHVLVGTPTFRWKRPGAFADSGDSVPPYAFVDSARETATAPVMRMLAGVRLGSDGSTSPIPQPDGVTMMLGTRAVAGRAGIAHVFWVTSPDSSVEIVYRNATLWHAETDGRRWSPPEPLLTATSLRWNPLSAATGTVGNDPILAVALSGGRAGKDSLEGIAILRRLAGRWISSAIPTPALAPLVALPPRVDMRPLVVFVDRRYGPGEPAGSVIVAATSSDGGRSWSAPVPVHRPSDPRINDLHVVPAAGDTISAIWVARTTGSSPVDRIEHALSADAGRSWRIRAPTRLAELVRGLEPIWTTAGELRMVMRSEETSRLVETVWLEGAWRPLVLLPFEPAATDPTLSRRPDGEVVLAVGVARGGAIPYAPGVPAPALLLSTLRTRCEQSRRR